jgi:hypothetical protein
MALLRKYPALAALKLGGDQEYGVNIIPRAIEEPSGDGAHDDMGGMGMWPARKMQPEALDVSHE